MPKGLAQPVRDNIDKCRQATLAAVDTYNRPGPRFRTAQFIVLAVMAWTALFHAIFYRRGTKPIYKKGARFIKVDGEPKHWELAECVKQYYGSDNPAERRNLEFLIGLRNKIEHRYLPHLDPSLYGECQAALNNLETLMVDKFGVKYALAEYLGIALQFSQVMPDERAKAIKSAVRTSAMPVTSYVEEFRAGLPDTVLGSMKFSFSVFLVPRVVNKEKAADASVQFIKVDETSPEELERFQRLNVLIRDRHIPIANLNLHRPGEVIERLNTSIPYEITQHHHTCAWRHFDVRPSKGAGKKDKTDGRYCVYDAAHGDYVYTEAWCEKLVAELGDAAKFKSITGQTPIHK